MQNKKKYYIDNDRLTALTLKLTIRVANNKTN